MSGLMDVRTNAVCPRCGSVFHPSLDDFKMERTVRCPNGHPVQLIDQGDGLRNADRELDRTIRKLRQKGIKVTFRNRR